MVPLRAVNVVVRSTSQATSSMTTCFQRLSHVLLRSDVAYRQRKGVPGSTPTPGFFNDLLEPPFFSLRHEFLVWSGLDPTNIHKKAKEN